MFDWITLSVWLIGLVILVIWIIVPIKEFNQMRKRMKAKQEKISDNLRGQ